MLLTLTARCLLPLLTASGRGKKTPPKLDLLDLPTYTRHELGLAGLNLSTDLLAGADRTRLESIRERADRASCACLLLVETEPQNFGSDGEPGKAAAVRMGKVVDAAHILGCSAAAVQIIAHDDDAVLAKVAQRLLPVMTRAEKLDINLLISPAPGLTERPERVTELLKKVGGFRLGTYPDFEAASKAKDPNVYLHRLTPYATVVSAASIKFSPTKKDGQPTIEAFREGTWRHQPYDLAAMVKAITSVGYDGPLAIDFRGSGDLILGVTQTRDALMAALGDDVPDQL